MVVQFLNAVLVVAESSKLGEVEVVVFTFYWGDGPWKQGFQMRYLDLNLEALLPI